MSPDIYFIAADEQELNGLLKGELPATAFPWMGSSNVVRIPKGSTGVLAKQTDRSARFVQPIAIVASPEDQRRLFGRISQVRSDLAPLTAWCHIVPPSQFHSIDSLSRDARLGGYEAAWTGLAVAHALLLSERPISKLKMAACLATETFAIARSRALWEPVSIASVLERYDAVHQLLRTRESRNQAVRSALEPVWACLASASSGDSSEVTDPQFRTLVQAIGELHNAKLTNSPDEALRFGAALPIPEAEVLQRLPNLTPEQRVREFDRIVASFTNSPRSDLVSRHMRAMIAAYLTTVVAGGGASLSLLDPHVRSSPELMAWAYVLGSLGQRVVWTSAFDGLGRLVARELMRSLHLDEGPYCDFAVEEALVVFDAQLPDPLVHLRVKQSRIITVALAPGVNIQVGFADTSTTDGRHGDSNGHKERITTDLDKRQDIELVADAVWRRLRDRVEGHVHDLFRQEKRKSSKRLSWQEKLPLKNEGEK